MVEGNGHPWPKIIFWLAAGIFAGGAALDALVNSITIFTPLRAGVATVLVFASLAVLDISLRWSRPRVGSRSSVRIQSLGTKYYVGAVGFCALFWVGAIASQPQPKEAPATQEMEQAPGHDDCSNATVRVNTESLGNAKGVEARIPVFQNPCRQRSLDVVNGAMKKLRDSEVQEFIKRDAEIEKEASDLPPYGPDGRFLNLTCRTRMATTTIVSVLCLHRHFHGDMQGHTFHETRSFNFELDSAAAHPFALDDVLVDGSFAYRELDRLIKERLRSQGLDFSWFNESGASLERELAEGFGLSPGGAVFRLERYSTGPYIDGAREVTLSYDVLRDVFRADGPQSRLN